MLIEPAVAASGCQSALLGEILDEAIAMASANGERIGIDEAARIMATY
jgi:hypothetical protein